MQSDSYRVELYSKSFPRSRCSSVPSRRSLDLDKLPFIYDAYELRYHERYVRIAQNAIQRVASTFGPNQFYNDRFTVEAALNAAATAALSDVNATVHEF